MFVYFFFLKHCRLTFLTHLSVLVSSSHGPVFVGSHALDLC
jgi:hypothetical protein